MRIISILNLKGGTGKTTVTINLGAALALAEKKTLLMDLDPKWHLSAGMGIDEAGIRQHIRKEKQSLADLIRDTEIEYLKILPSISGCGSIIFKNAVKEDILKRLLGENRENFDYALIDCPPSPGFINLMAMSLSDSILIPLQCEYLSLVSLKQLIRLYNNVKNNVNHELKIEGILMNMVEKEDETSLKIEDEIRKSFPDLVFRTTIPESREVKESPCHGTPVLLQNIACTGSRSYLNLAGEIIRKTKDHSKGADV